MELRFTVALFSHNLGPILYIPIKFRVTNHLGIVLEGFKSLFVFLAIFGHPKIEMSNSRVKIEINRF